MDRTPRQLEALVEHQVRRWSTSGSAAVALAPPRHRPVVTISREYGARGAALGRLLADRLRFDFWDQKIVHAIAEDAGLSDRVVESLDEHRQNAIASGLAAFLKGAGLTTSDYANRLARVIHTVAEHGSAVIVGRGAQFLLPAPSCLRVRVVMPLEERVAGLAARKGLDERAARAEVRETDADRDGFMRKVYGKDIALPVHYDLVVNTGTLGLEGAAAVLAAAYEARFGG